MIHSSQMDKRTLCALIFLLIEPSVFLSLHIVPQKYWNDSPCPIFQINTTNKMTSTKTDKQLDKGPVFLWQCLEMALYSLWHPLGFSLWSLHEWMNKWMNISFLHVVQAAQVFISWLNGFYQCSSAIDMSQEGPAAPMMGERRKPGNEIITKSPCMEEGLGGGGVPNRTSPRRSCPWCKL